MEDAIPFHPEYTKTNVGKRCVQCHTTEDLKLCSSCKAVKYCSRECQKMNWKIHKTLCGMLKMRNQPVEHHESNTDVKVIHPMKAPIATMVVRVAEMLGEHTVNDASEQLGTTVNRAGSILLGSWTAHMSIVCKTLMANAPQKDDVQGVDKIFQPTTKAEMDLRDEVEKRSSEVLFSKKVAADPNTYEKLHDYTWLDGRSETEVFDLLADTFRTVNLTAQSDRNVYRMTARAVFSMFVTGAYHNGRLPDWWSSTKTDDCVERATADCNLHNIYATTSKKEMVKKYKNRFITLQMIVFASLTDPKSPDLSTLWPWKRTPETCAAIVAAVFFMR